MIDDFSNDVIQQLAQNILSCIMQFADDTIKEKWHKLSKIDKKEILSALEDTIYEWLSRDDVFNQIMDDRIWPL